MLILEKFESLSARSGKIGQIYHAVQDFYSHSNYVEIYKSIYGETDVTLIPTFKEAMTLTKYKVFATALQKSLKTGEYDDKNPKTDANSHKGMNHDVGAGSEYENNSFVKEVQGKIVNWNSRAAEAAATKETLLLNLKIEAEIK